MPTKLNLASKPFSNRSLPWAVTAIVIFISLISLVFIVRVTARAKAQAYAVQNDINGLARQEQQLREQVQAVKNSLTSEQLQTLAELELTVVAKTPSTITDMISEMDRAGIFHAELRSQNLQRGRGETGAEYELYVVYRPRAGSPTDTVASVTRETSTADLSKGGGR